MFPGVKGLEELIKHYWYIPLSALYEIGLHKNVRKRKTLEKQILETIRDVFDRAFGSWRYVLHQ